MNWFKSLPIWAILGAVLAAVFMVLRARSAGALEVQVEHDESRIKELNKGTEADIHEAAALQRGITVKKIKAREVRKKSEASLERLGEDETMADIAQRFNNGRVRKRTAPIAPVRGSKKKRSRSN